MYNAKHRLFAIVKLTQGEKPMGCLTDSYSLALVGPPRQPTINNFFGYFQIKFIRKSSL
jgi:hypothetical protein